MVQAESDKIKVLIVDDIAETRENLSKLLYFEPDIEIAGTAANGREAIDLSRTLAPDIVLMDINMPDMDGITTSQEIGRVAPGSQVIMMSVQSEADYLRRSMLAGAMDYLTKPFSSEELSASIRRVYKMGASRRASLPPAPVMDETPGAGLGQAARARPSGGKLIVIYSPKGGTGCSTVATNLTISLRQLTSKRVVLVDANLQFGDIAVLLNLTGQHSLADAISRSDELDTILMSAILSPHPSGIQVLPAPPTPEVAETITAAEVTEVLDYLLSDFDYVVLDTATYLDDTVLAAMDRADRLMVVMTPEIPAIKSTKLFFEIAEALQYPLERVDLVLNKVLPRDDIRREALERSIKHTIRAQLALETRGLRQATNQGVPFVMAEPHHPLSESFVELARQELALLEPQPEEQPAKAAPQPQIGRRKRGGLFGRLKQ